MLSLSLSACSLQKHLARKLASEWLLVCQVLLDSVTPGALNLPYRYLRAEITEPGVFVGGTWMTVGMCFAGIDLDDARELDLGCV